MLWLQLRSSVTTKFIIFLANQAVCVRQKVKKKPWTKAESNAVLSHFDGFIKRCKNPGKADVEYCVEKNPVLKDRPWKVIKDYVRNHIVKVQKQKKQ